MGLMRGWCAWVCASASRRRGGGEGAESAGKRTHGGAEGAEGRPCPNTSGCAAARASSRTQKPLAVVVIYAQKLRIVRGHIARFFRNSCGLALALRSRMALYALAINSITSRIIGTAIEVHRRLGPGLLESAYQACLVFELRERGLHVEVEKAVPLVYKDIRLDCGYRLDLVVDGKVIVDVKSVENLAPTHEAQVITYLRLTGCEVGLLLNFNVPVMKQGIRRLATKQASSRLRTEPARAAPVLTGAGVETQKPRKKRLMDIDSVSFWAFCSQHQRLCRCSGRDSQPPRPPRLRVIFSVLSVPSRASIFRGAHAARVRRGFV